MKSSTGVLAVAAIAIFAVAGCSDAGSTTCSEFQAQSSADQSSTLRSLLSEHDLKMLDSGNTIGVTNAVTSFCSMSGNSGTSIDDAVDWDSGTW